MKTETMRSSALTHLVGYTRAFVHQIDYVRRELEETQDGDLVLVLKAVNEIAVQLKVLDGLATNKLRNT